MIVKWIVCQVPPARRGAFDRAQRAWAVLEGAPGFIGQIGGWSTEHNTACVLGLWRDLRAYEAFMSRLHDGLAEAGQGTYTHIRTALFEAPEDEREAFLGAVAELVIIEDAVERSRWPGLTRAERGLSLERPGDGAPSDRAERHGLALVPEWRVLPRGA